MIKLEINNRTGRTIFLSKLLDAAQRTSAIQKVRQSRRVSVALVNNREIQKLNKRYRGKNKPTDVLSFALETPDLGEIVISLPEAVKSASRLGHSWHREMQFLLVHGLLHLLGYDHETARDRRRMEAVQDKIMSAL
ncbi:MAG: rRNA maturation RNase YbeY [Patescibacteria group bacterium]